MNKQLGDIAQLGARLNGIQEAEGSSPFISIQKEFTFVGSFFVRIGLERGLKVRVPVVPLRRESLYLHTSNKAIKDVQGLWWLYYLC